ncbi:MAG: hypothetical protein WBQ77_11405, partial [Methyloceanibacter sp.]|uniref:hypothetical protein n=1 Tax=Methyloceanibacter sp. TaxID=1965321 RepID=UPI003C415DB7
AIVSRVGQASFMTGSVAHDCGFQAIRPLSQYSPALSGGSFLDNLLRSYTQNLVTVLGMLPAQ